MSPRSWRFRLADIRASINKILDATRTHDKRSFTEDDILVHAVMMHPVIIGEAANQLPETVRTLRPEVPWHEIRAMRNFVTHAYFAVDLELIWGTVTRDLQSMLSQLEGLEDEAGADE